MSWKKRSEREEGTSWEREGSPCGPTKIRGKPDRTGERALFRISESTVIMTPAGPSASIEAPECSAKASLLQFFSDTCSLLDTT